MKTHVITHVQCPCGHHGSIIECFGDESTAEEWYLSCLRELSHAGDYEGLDPLFADTTPACPLCGRSLYPEHVVARGERVHATQT
jgi:hypothetical protein